MKRTIIIDWNSLVDKYSNRDFPYKNRSFIINLINIIKKLKYNKDEVFIVSDAYTTWRKMFVKDYKMKSDLLLLKIHYFNSRKLWEVLNQALDWHFLKISKTESLDIMSTIIKNNLDKEIILVTSYKEAEQFFKYDNVQVFSPISKEFKKKVKYTPAKYMKKANSIEETIIYDLINLPEFVKIKVNNVLGSLSNKELNLNHIKNEEIEYKFKKLLLK